MTAIDKARESLKEARQLIRRSYSRIAPPSRATKFDDVRSALEKLADAVSAVIGDDSH